MIARGIARASCAALVLVASACAQGPFAPSGLAVRAEASSFQPGEEADFTAIRSGGLPFLDNRVRWSVDPPELGTIDPDGHFTAGARSGSGVVTATNGGVSGTTEVTVACPATRLVRDITFRVRCNAAADVYTEQTLDQVSVAAVLALVDSDVASLEKDLGRRFRSQALIYVFDNASSYVNGVRRILGDRAARQATHSDGFFAPWVDAVALDWYSISRNDPVTAIRHELTHRMVWQLSGTTAAWVFDGLDKGALADVPAWFNEGLATVEESTVSGAEWLADEDRILAATVYPLARLELGDLADLGKWNQRTGSIGFYQYTLAAQAVRQLSEDVGREGIVQILERLHRGGSFADAYHAASGFPYVSFASRFGARVRAGLPPVPGLMLAHDGGYTGLLLYGFAPGATVTLAFRGPTSMTTVQPVDEYGNYMITLGAAYPVGTYAVTTSVGGAPIKTFTITK